jgi:hypothetical protein
VGRRQVECYPPHLIAIGKAVRRGGDDAVIGGDAGGEFDLAAEVAGDGDGLEQDPVVRRDGGHAQPALVEDQRARRDVQRRGIAPLQELQFRRTRLSKDCGASFSSEIG